jgi:hypothetical protein
MGHGVLVGRYLADVPEGIIVSVINHKGQKVDVPVELQGSMIENVKKYCKEDDVIGVKYYLAPSRLVGVAFIAEKVTFMSRETAGEEIGGEIDGNI